MEDTGFNIDSFIGIENAVKVLEENPEEYANLFADNFMLADLDISARVLQHWYKSGLLPDRDLQGRKHRFSFNELIYLYMVQDLRDIGFSFERIKKFKSFIFYKVDPVDVLTNNGFDNSMSLEKEQAINGIRAFFEQFPKEQRLISHIGILLFFVIGLKKETDIIVLMDGSAYIEPTRKGLNASAFDLENETRITLPVFKYLKKFISKEKYFEMLSSFRLINEREQYLLRQVRDGNYSSMKIKFGKGKIELIELTTEKKIDNAARFNDILLKGGYQSIELKTQDGTISYSAITTKKKFK